MAVQIGKGKEKEVSDLCEGGKQRLFAGKEFCEDWGKDSNGKRDRKLSPRRKEKWRDEVSGRGKKTGVPFFPDGIWRPVRKK